MKQFAYRVIYNSQINYVLRNINKLLLPILPAKIKLPPSGTIKMLNPNSKPFKMRTNQTNYLTQLIFWNGGYKNFEYTPIFLDIIKDMDTFFDIGANIGLYSLIAANENPKIKVVGFEPAVGPLYYFTQNVEINGFKNIRIEPIALSHKNGEIEFFEMKNPKYKYLKFNLSGENNAKQKFDKNETVVRKVPTTTLDEFVKINAYKNIDLIKMDTEGTENLILESSSQVIESMKPIIICETLFQAIEPELERIMKSHGYEFYNHTEEGLVHVESIVRATDNGVRNCFFVHPSKYSIIEKHVVNK